MKRGRVGEQLSVHIRLGSDPLMSMVMSVDDSQKLLDTLDGTIDDVDAMFTALLMMTICHIHWIPIKAALLGMSEVVDREKDKMRAEMEGPDDSDLPF